MDLSTSAHPRLAAVGLLDLPYSCLEQIIRCLDCHSRRQLYKICRSSVVTMCKNGKPRFTKCIPACDQLASEPSSILHLAGQVSTAAELRLDCRYRELTEVLRSVLVMQQSGSSAGSVQASPVPYPGITSLYLWRARCQSLIPEVLTTAFPNLRQLRLSNWATCDSSLPSGPVLTQGLQDIQHITLTCPDKQSGSVLEHIAQQLRYLSSLTSLNVNNEVLAAAVPWTALTGLTQLSYDDDMPLGCDSSFPKCEMEMLYSPFNITPWATHVFKGDTCWLVSDAVMPALLAQSRITNLSLVTSGVSGDYSQAPCNWQQIRFTQACSNLVSRLPLHALVQPIECPIFEFEYTEDGAFDLTGLATAAPHLQRCGGIKVTSSTVRFSQPYLRSITTQAATEAVQAWAPFLSDIRTVQVQNGHVAVEVSPAVRAVWPEAQVKVMVHPIYARYARAEDL